jgi:cytochrome bd ubiquinol oxidase subunit I
MEFADVLLSRLQFAFTIAFHILFPTLTIGLGAFLVLIEGLWLKTGDRIYEQLYRFWTKVFALTFGMGVVTGVVLSYEVGTNWSRFADMTGNVLGPLFIYEVLSAFFLEAGFVGIMLFGLNRVGPRMHFFATAMVSFGTLVSAFWIIAANSFMQTPAGVHMEDGRLIVDSWLDVVFNPSLPTRFLHMVLASYVTAMFVVAGISALHLVMDRPPQLARRAHSIAIAALAVLVPLQIFVGDASGLVAEKHQPAKIAAFEGRWETMAGAPLLLFALPDQAREANRLEIGIPKLASLILTHNLNGEVRGLKEFAPQDRPHVFTAFWAFRVMVGVGVLMLAIVGWSLTWWWRGRLHESGLLLTAHIGMIPLGFVATLAGWTAAEVGRQPWVVYGVMRTLDGASRLPVASVASSLALFFVVYNVLLAAYAYFLTRLVWRGPDDRVQMPTHTEPTLAKRALMPAE